MLIQLNKNKRLCDGVVEWLTRRTSTLGSKDRYQFKPSQGQALFL